MANIKPENLREEDACVKSDVSVSDNYVHFSYFYVAGFTYHEGPMLFDQFAIGKRLTLCREADNSYDPNAVPIRYNGRKIGYVPRPENGMLAHFLSMGYGDIFQAYINRVNPAANTEQQVGVVVYLVRKGATVEE